MHEPIAYFCGSLVPFSSVSISPGDSGFVLGTTVAEQLRTFGGRLFRLGDHLTRLAQSLEIVGISIAESHDQLIEICHGLVDHNHPLLEQGDDLGLAILVTPGVYPGYRAADQPGPTVCLHTYPLPFHLWHDRYDQGQKLVVPSVRQVPGECWPAALKCRSRMHYYLADREAAATEPDARALLLDAAGHVAEASTANVLLYAEGRLVSPPHDKVLPGISLAEAIELGRRLETPLVELDLTLEDVCRADEVFLTSTPLCLLPVASLDGRPISGGQPGPFFHRLIEEWSREVKVDIIAQAKRFACRV